MNYKIIVFLVLNFAALGIGGLFMKSGTSSDWYLEMNKAPWTPPGWMFGAAWSTIMICFSFYMAKLYDTHSNKQLIILLYGLQLLLNIGWNPSFFYFQNVLLGLIVITLLTVLVWYFFVRFYPDVKSYSYLLLPYGVWLLIATSLNAYILVKN